MTELPRVFTIDWAKAVDFRTFVQLYGLIHKDAVAFPAEDDMSTIPEKVRKCLVEMPPEVVKANLEQHEANMQRQKEIYQKMQSGLILPK